MNYGTSTHSKKWIFTQAQIVRGSNCAQRALCLSQGQRRCTREQGATAAAAVHPALQRDQSFHATHSNARGVASNRGPRLAPHPRVTPAGRAPAGCPRGGRVQRDGATSGARAANDRPHATERRAGASAAELPAGAGAKHLRGVQASSAAQEGRKRSVHFPATFLPEPLRDAARPAADHRCLYLHRSQGARVWGPGGSALPPLHHARTQAISCVTQAASTPHSSPSPRA